MKKRGLAVVSTPSGHRSGSPKRLISMGFPGSPTYESPLFRRFPASWKSSVGIHRPRRSTEEYA